MPKEIELRIIDIDLKGAVECLKKLGAKRIAFRKYKHMEIRIINTPKFTPRFVRPLGFRFWSP
jgi:hypothetical protein